MIRALLAILALVACGEPMLLLVGPPAGGTPANKLLIIGGQSQATGKQVPADVTVYPGLTSAYPAVQLVDHNAPTQADPPVFFNEGGQRDLAARTIALSATFPIGTAGPELVIGRELATRTIDTWSIGKMTISGSSLITGWNNAAYPTGGPSLRDQFITFIQDQIDAFDIADPATDMTLLWQQGESDNGDTFANYLAALEDFFGALRAEFGNFRIILTRVNYLRTDTTRNIGSAQECFVAGTTNARIVPADDATFVDPTFITDVGHYSSDYVATLAVAISDAIIDSINGDVPDGPYIVATGPIAEVDSAHNVTPTIPPHVAGDILVAYLSGFGNNNYAMTDNGFAEVAESPEHDGGSAFNARLQVASKVAAGPGTTFTISDIAADDYKVACVTVIRGATSIEDAQGAVAATGTGVTFPTATAGGPHRLVMNIAAIRVDSDTPQISGWTNAGLADLTAHVNRETASSVGFGLGMAVGRKVSSGPVAATTATVATTSTQALITLVVAP